MKRTIAWPPRIVGGRAQLTADPTDPDAADLGEALRQVIRLGLFDASCSNPWQAEALGTPEQSFGPATAATAGQLEQRVRARFDALEAERRARLVSVSVSVSGSTRRVAIEYEDLEQGRRRSLEVAGA